MAANKTITYVICEDCKAKKLLINKGEKLFVEFQLGMNGSFYTSFFRAAMVADTINSHKLYEGFPEEIEAVRKFKNEDGYWEELQERYNISLKA